jgi:hypothetical protein
MPSAAEHQEKYLRNRHFLNADGGLATKEPAWAAVVAFYAALHLVDRLAARMNIHHTNPGAHGKRARFVATRHRTIFAAYQLLRTASEIARYGTVNQFQRAYPGTAPQTVLVDTHLVAIENYVDAIFNPRPPAGSSGGI